MNDSALSDLRITACEAVWLLVRCVDPAGDSRGVPTVDELRDTAARLMDAVLATRERK